MVSANELPGEILERVFFYLSPYRDLDNVMLVCRRWYEIGKGVIYYRQCRFVEALRQEEAFIWQLLGSDTRSHPSSPTPINVPAKRFGASLIHYQDRLYMFGGATNQQTTFNDLWMYDMTDRRWSRLLPKGDYPPPRACATGIRFHNNFIIYGGFELRPTSLVWVSSHWLNTAYVYNILTNQWSNLHLLPAKSQAMLPTAALPNAVGQSVCLLQHSRLVLFGGYQHDALSNEAHIIELASGEWWPLELAETSPRPKPRYGHSAVALSDTRMLLLGGDVGPNDHANDIWLLTAEPGGERWRWTEVRVEASPLWGIPPTLKHQTVLKIPGRSLVVVISYPNISLDECLQKNGVLPPPIPQEREPEAVHVEPLPPAEDMERVVRPSIRPNARANRQLQLAALQVQENRMLVREQNREIRNVNQRSVPTPLRKRPLCLYTLDLNGLCNEDNSGTNGTRPTVQWINVNPAFQDWEHAPGERFGHVAVVAHQEIFLLGGLVTRAGPGRQRVTLDHVIVDRLMHTDNDSELFELSGNYYVLRPLKLCRRS